MKTVQRFQFLPGIVYGAMQHDTVNTIAIQCNPRRRNTMQHKAMELY